LPNASAIHFLFTAKQQECAGRNIGHEIDTMICAFQFDKMRERCTELCAQHGHKQKAIEQYQAVIEMKPFGVDLAEIEKKLDTLE